MKKNILLTLFLLLQITVFAQDSGVKGFNSPLYSVAPNFKIEMSDGQMVELEKLKGKVVFIDFGGLQCGPCIAAMRTFKKELFEKYSKDELAVVPIIIDAKTNDELLKFLERHKFDFPIAAGSGKGVSSKFMSKGSGVPRWVVIDKWGVIVECGTDGAYKEAIKTAVNTTTYEKTRKMSSNISELITSKDKYSIRLSNYGLPIEPYVVRKDKNSTQLIETIRDAYTEGNSVEFEVTVGAPKIISVRKLPKVFLPMAEGKKNPVKNEPKEITKEVYNGKGIKFQDITLEEALEKAKAENKKVFLDCYTTWCGPCKTMDKYVFPLEVVGKYFNNTFVNVKFDMETPRALNVKRYPISGYPTYLILNPDGTVYHKMVGGRTEFEFIDEVKGVMEDSKKSITYLEEAYSNSTMNLEEASNYLIAAIKMGDGRKAELARSKMMSKVTAEDRLDKHYWVILQNSPFDSGDYNFIVKNIDILRKNIGNEKIDKYLSYTLRQPFTALQYCPPPSLSAAYSEINVEKYIAATRSLEFESKNDVIEVINLIDAAVKRDGAKFSAALDILVKNMNPDYVSFMLDSALKYGSKGDCEILLSTKSKIKTLNFTAKSAENINEQIEKLEKKIKNN